jgi:predicted nucleic acid-binding Zn ribbon protein
MPIGSGNPKILKSLLNDLIDTKGWSEKMIEQKIPDLWAEVVGEQAAKVTEVVSFKDGDLIIKTESSTWRIELKLRMVQIIEKMNQSLGAEVIKTLKFR